MSPCINKICSAEKAKIQSKESSLILFVKGNTMRALRLGNPYHAEARIAPKKHNVDIRLLAQSGTTGLVWVRL